MTAARELRSLGLDGEEAVVRALDLAEGTGEPPAPALGSVLDLGIAAWPGYLNPLRERAGWLLQPGAGAHTELHCITVNAKFRNV